MAGRRRKQDWSGRTDSRDFKDEVSNVVHDAMQAFWAVVAKNYPESRSGDMMPGQIEAQQNANLVAVLHWLEANAGGDLARFADAWLGQIRRQGGV